MKITLLVVAAILWVSISVKAQTTCVGEAQRLYEQGRINEVPDQLASCLANTSIETADKIAAYKLQTNTYLYLNEKEKAEAAMTNFLKSNPEYILDPSIDSPEFINLFHSFRTHPVLFIGGKAGGNLTGIYVQNTFSVDNLTMANQDSHGKLGYQFGLTAEIPFGEKLSLNPELMLSMRSTDYTQTSLGFAEVTMKERQTWAELPLLFKYNLAMDSKKSQLFFINAGASVNYLLASKMDGLRKDQAVDGGNRTLELKDRDISLLRNRINYSAIIGAGVKLKNILGRGYLTIEGRYNYGLRNIVSASKRGSDTMLVYDYLYLDNNFTQNSFSLSLGYIIPKYRPKLRHKR